LHFSKITPNRFRNLSPDPIFLGKGPHVIAGENGQGKTNLLEAVALLCGQRSFRRARPSACAPDGREFAVSGELLGDGRVETLRVDWTISAGRRFSRAGKAASFREISELAPAVFLAPEHRELLCGHPEARRRFLDRLVLGSKPAAGDDLARFERALAERNALLSRGGAPGSGELEAWTEELVLSGSAVRRHRSAALSEWRGFFEPLARQAGSEYAEIGVDYPAGEQSAEGLRAECERMVALERRRGYSLCGPHRDDVLFTRRGRPLAAEASSGEVLRILALVKLAEWHAISRARGRQVEPLFAADDFDAGLSQASVEAFLEAMPAQAQVLLTTASDPARWKGRVAAIWMRAGRALSPAPPVVSVSGARG